MKKHKTTSFTIDVKNSSFNKLKDRFVIYRYTLPAYLNFRKKHFGLLHNWAKSNIDDPYYLHFPTKKIYVLFKKNAEPKKLCYGDYTLPIGVFDDFEKESLIHVWLKVLLAEYMRSKGLFISNDSFYINSELSKDKSWATVLEINLKHDYKNNEAVIFNLVDKATRLKQVDIEDYEQYHKHSIPYGLTFKNTTAVFKQLKKKEINYYSRDIFVKPKPIKGNSFKTAINFHSIKNEADHKKSRSFLINNFLPQFLDFLYQHDISVSQKELNLERVDKKYKTETLRNHNIKISLIDGRKNKSVPLDKALKLSEILDNDIHVEEKKIDKVATNESILFVMDYSKEDFEKLFPSEKDPYLKLKESESFKDIPKQGICVNELSFKDKNSLDAEDYLSYYGLTDKELKRNLSVCLNQLILKSILLSGDYSRLPQTELLDHKLFIYKGKALFLAQGTLKMKNINSAEELEQLASEVTSRSDILDILINIHRYHNPFLQKDLEPNFDRYRLIIAKDSVIELTDYPERFLYDDDEIKARVDSSYRKRPISEFKANESSDLAIEYNEYIDNNVEELSLSYNEFKKKYGKGEDGFLKTIFHKNEIKATYKDTSFLKFLEENKGLKIKGLKQDKVFAAHTGIWFDKLQMQYFVGRNLSYKYEQDKGFQMKKILVHSGQFNEETFFPLLKIDFIRFKELTVNPYPFKLIDMRTEIEGDKL